MPRSQLFLPIIFRFIVVWNIPLDIFFEIRKQIAFPRTERKRSVINLIYKCMSHIQKYFLQILASEIEMLKA
jgi:hypothetical protein